MYHKYDKSNWKVRKALYEVYKHKCSCCGDRILPKNMHIDHIYATENKISSNEEYIAYINKLFSEGFEIDSLENYRPTCQNCNLSKNNRNFNQLNTLQSLLDKAYGLADNVEALIKSYTDEMSFDDYNPDYLYWKKLDFKNQKDISDAIYGSRLNECHVNSCPDLGQVNELVMRLKNVDYAVVSSEPGCGKSITIHKCAYEYYKDGWAIFKLNEMEFDGDINVPPFINFDKELLIIDDAQKIPHYKLLNLVCQSKKYCKIILAFTDTSNSIDVFREPIRITKIDAVNNMYSYYIRNKKEIFPIVKNINKDIGNDSMSISYEKILEECKKQDRPWMFNYILRGGWKNEKENYQSICHINHISLLIASIAFNQIVLLDECSDFNNIASFYERHRIKWSTKDLDILLRKNIIVSTDELRIIHLQSAISLLHAFYKCSSMNEKKLFSEYELNYLNKNKTSYQGLLWLYNMSITYMGLSTYLFNNSIIDYCLNNILEITEDIEKGFALYLLERIDIIDVKKVNSFVKNKIDVFASWLSSPSDKTVYCFSNFINGIINLKDDTIIQLRKHINFGHVYDCFKKANPNYFYSWCEFFNRLVFLLSSKKEINVYAKSIYNISKNMNNVPIISYVCGVAKLLYFDEKYLNLILLKKDELNCSLTHNFIDSLELFRGDSPLMIFGYSSFGKIKITDTRKKVGNMILDLIPIDQLSDYISNSEPRDWLTIETIGQILFEYKRPEYKKIVDSIDLNKLSQASRDLWKESSHDLIYLIIFLGMCDGELTGRFIERNISLIKRMDLIILSYIPDKITSCIDSGVNIEFFTSYNANLVYNLLSYYLGKGSISNILALLKDNFIKKIMNLCILDFEANKNDDYKIFNDILALIEKGNEEFLRNSFSYLDDETLFKVKGRMDNDSRLNNDVKTNFNNFIMFISKYTGRNLNKMIYLTDRKVCEN